MAKVTIEIDIEDCRNCPFRRDHRGHGECWEECAHKQHGQSLFGNILWGCQERFTKTPRWCPLGLGNTTKE